MIAEATKRMELELSRASVTARNALAVRVLPRRPRRGEDLLDSHRMHSTNEVRAIDLVSVSDDILRR